MNQKTKTGLEILESAVLLGVLGDALLRATPWGLNVLLWIAALAAAMIALVVRRRGNIGRESLWLHGALIFFAACFVWRDSLTLKVLDTMILLGILSIMTLSALGIRAKVAGFVQYAAGSIFAGASAAFAPFFLIFGDIEWKTIPAKGWMRHATAVLRGLAIALPILLVFGGLFMAADAVFEGIVKNTLRIDPDVLFSHFLLFGFLTWITAGYLRGALADDAGAMVKSFFDSPARPQNVAPPVVPTNETSSEQTATPRSVTEDSDPPNKENAQNVNAENKASNGFFSLGTIEIGVVLGLINLLFLGFVLVQVQYFFGGMELVQNTPDFKLAEYARRGFFELCWVAGLMLPILLVSHWLMRKNESAAEKLFRVLAVVNIGLLFVIMFSAVQRMLLYTGELGYGLTTARLYPTAFMLWLALVFVWFGWTVLRGQANKFAWGALWTAFAVVGGLHVLNPDDLVVRVNTELMRQGRALDAEYLTVLSDDAVPATARALPELNFLQQCAVKRDFSRRLEENRMADFRTFNFSRSTAHDVLKNYEGNLDTNGCPPPPGSFYRKF